MVYVLRPSGLFQKAISEVSSKFSNDEYRFELVICSALSDLHECVNVKQLTPDMGGVLLYSHHEWIQQRIVSSYLQKNIFKIFITIQNLLNWPSDLSIKNIKHIFSDHNVCKHVIRTIFTP